MNAGRVGLDDFTAAGATAEDVQALPSIPLWPELAPEALHGLAGRIVRACDDYTEADRCAVLVHLLAGFGNAVGSAPHARVGADLHPARLNVALIGTTSRGRKGTAWGPPRALLERADPVWTSARVRSGLSSGEGLIFHVRDSREEQQPIKERGRVVSHERVRVDEGEPDKRLFVLEPEFASVLRRMRGEGNSLSAVLRLAWDSGDLSTLTRNAPLRATGAHISVVAHVTEEELRAHVTELDLANGLLNRFLLHLVRRSKLLPDGAALPAATLDTLSGELAQAVAVARTRDLVRRDDEAAKDWRAVYPALSEGTGGLAGAVTARAEAQVLRLSLIYALLDQSPAIRAPHLDAALAVWQHAEASARRIFGDALGLALPDRVLGLLRGHGPMDLTELHAALGRHVDGPALRGALAELQARRLASPATIPTKGRARQVWQAVAR